MLLKLFFLSLAGFLRKPFAINIYREKRAKKKLRAPTSRRLDDVLLCGNGVKCNLINLHNSLQYQTVVSVHNFLFFFRGVMGKKN